MSSECSLVLYSCRNLLSCMMHTSDALEAGFKVHLQVGVAGFDVVEAGIWYQNTALRSPGTFAVDKWKNVTETSNEHWIICIYFQEVWRYLQATPWLHSSPQRALHNDDFSSPAATVECLVVTVLLYSFSTQLDVVKQITAEEEDIQMKLSFYRLHRLFLFAGDWL